LIKLITRSTGWDWWRRNTSLSFRSSAVRFLSFGVKLARQTPLLTLEIKTAQWPSKDPAGNPSAHSRDRLANPLWGAPRIHGELLKLGIDIGQTTVAKYMARGRRPPSQGWKTFLHNHADGIASIDLFVVPTISFRLLYGLLLLHHDRRQILWLGVTAHPTAEWISHQLTEAYGWKVAPRYIIRARRRLR
jgi:hypothetical protein